MRKLTVKNFSVIREAELEFGKITVLIGPQASGKSLLCKLAYFLGKELVELAVKSVLNGDPWAKFLKTASREFATNFPGNGEYSEVSFSSFRYEALINWKIGALDPDLDFSRAFKDEYESQIGEFHLDVPSASGAFFPGGLSVRNIRESIWIALNGVLSKSLLDLVIYVPAVRAPFTATPSINGENQVAGPSSIQREFSELIQWASRWKVGLLTTGRGVTDEISRNMTEILRGFVMVDSGVPLFLATDGRKLPLDSYRLIRK